MTTVFHAGVDGSFRKISANSEERIFIEQIKAPILKKKRIPGS